MSPRGLRLPWLVLGLVCVALGAIGVVVPGLPTTIFFIAAAACFGRSSDRLERWVLGLPRIGPAVSDYRNGLGMARKAKVLAVSSIVVFSGLAVLVVVEDPVPRAAILAAAAVGVIYVSWRVPTRERVLAQGGEEPTDA
ncbi:MAG: YbaN family protein [Actinomycetota bacterium]